MSKYVLRAEGITKTFLQGGHPVPVLRGVNIEIMQGEMMALVGFSGSGKSTLLHILGLLERSDGGYLTIGERFTADMRASEATAVRLAMIGFVYQFHHLLPEFTALENVILPQMIAGVKKATARDKAAELLESLGLAARLAHRPSQLSGGECQRVAIARALANNPIVLLADEPTGNLDPDTSAEVMEMLGSQVRARGLAALIATHNMDLAARMDRATRLLSGQLVSFVKQ